ncbi:MAG: hypothetical protein D6776_04295 [Planctomycetota bacterium]|nr:MAG: hypothetical protein D6776_04295 [Planctomycetota bacterium]
MGRSRGRGRWISGTRYGIALLVACGCALVASAAPEYAVLQGKSLEIHFPASERAVCETLLRDGEKALSLYTRYLKQQPVREPIRVFLYATAAEYEKAEAARTGGIFKTNLAFTYARDAEVHMVFQPRLDRAPGTGPGMLEALFMHEIAHAVQYRFFPSYDEFPDWLSEGVAEMFSERAVGGGKHCAERVPWFADLVYDVLDAVDTGRFVPLEKLLTEGLVDPDPGVRQIKYGESWALCRFLDDPANGDPKQFRQFVLDVAHMPRGAPLVKQARERFLATWPDLVDLERRLIFYLRKIAKKALPWQIVLREMRTLPDGGFVCESFPRNSALVLHRGEPLGPLARIEAEVVLDPAGSSGAQADVIFAYRRGDGFYKVAYGFNEQTGFVSLLRFDGRSWKTLANVRIDKGAIEPGRPHALLVDVDISRVVARLNGRTVLRHSLTDRSYGAGRWGVGCYDGRVRVRSAKGTSF